MRAGDTRRPFWDSSTSHWAERPPDCRRGDPVARFERRGDVDDQAHPAAAMVDDQHSVIVAERPGETHGPVRGSDDRRAAPRGEVNAARADAVGVYRAEPFDDRRAAGKLISKRRERRRASGWQTAAGRRVIGGEPTRRARGSTGCSPASPRSRSTSSPAAIATSPDASACPPARASAGLRALLQRGKLLPLGDNPAGCGPARHARRSPPGAAAAPWASSAATARRCGCGSPAESNQAAAALRRIRRCCHLGNRKQRRPARHDGETGEKRRRPGAARSASRCRCAAT